MSENRQPATPPTRAAVASGRGDFLVRGSWSKADVYLASVGGETIVVKDFSAKSLLVRWLGRLQISREHAAYEALAGVEGVARCLGRIGAHALALERLDAVPIRQLRKRDRSEELVDRLRGILEAIHARGVIHNDLRGQDNALVRPDGGIVLIDFAGAFRFRPGSIWYRLLFRRLSQVDRAAYLKWKRAISPEALSPEEERFLRRFARFRRLWVFNPKGALRQS